MGKRKPDVDLVRFVWKRNKMFDVMLLSEVETRNPFAFKVGKPVWQEIAKILQEGSLKMKVTERSCRDRVMELLKVHRLKERRSEVASGIEEPEMTEVDILLTSVAKLQEAGYDKQVKAVYKTDDKSDADAIRNAALLRVQDSDDESINGEMEFRFDDNNDSPAINVDDENILNISNESVPPNTDTNGATVNDSSVVISSSARNNSNSTSESGQSKSFEELSRRADTRGLHIFFGDDGNDNEMDEQTKEYEDPSEKLLSYSKNLSSGKHNPKNKLVRLLEEKSMQEFEMRKQELNMKKDELKVREQDRKDSLDFRKEDLKIRQLELKDNIDFRREELKIREADRKDEYELKRDEIKIREMEVAIKAKEVENKSKELDILLEKSKADAENQKKITELLVSIVANRAN